MDQQSGEYALATFAIAIICSVAVFMFTAIVTEDTTRNEIFQQCLENGKYEDTTGDKVNHRLINCKVDVWDRKPIKSD